MASAGDVNDDGFDDFLVAAPFDDTVGADAGRVQVRSGFDGSVIWTLDGAAGDRFGNSVHAVGDADGDGSGDFVVGAPGSNTSAPGYAILYSGATGTAMHTINGALAGDRVGFSVRGAGDVNGDGYDDVVVGAPQLGTGAGFARVISGFDGSVLHALTAGGTTNFGFSVGPAGDVNADGYADVVVGDPASAGFGNARVFSGLDGSVLHFLADGAVGSNFGFSSCGVGDVDNDGFDDVACSASHTVGAGAVRVFSGATGTLLFSLTGSTAGDFFGISVSPAGDMNADGNADVLVGAPQIGNGGPGYARVFSGADQSILYTYRGEVAGEQFGLEVGSAGHVDLDGYPEIIVGAPNTDGGIAGIAVGTAVVYSIQAYRDHDSSNSLTTAGIGGGLGRSMNSVGDVNGDDVPDYAIGAPLNSSLGNLQNGTVWVYSGANDSILWTFHGATDGEFMGTSVGAAGDVDNDSVNDIIVGAIGNGSVATLAGMARVYSGATGLPIWTFFGNSANDRLGFSVCGLGDVNVDGHDDVLVGLPQNGPAGQGSAWCFSGIDGSMLYFVNGVAINEWFGTSVACMGDVTGDGVSDFIVGGPEWPTGTGPGIVRAYNGATGVALGYTVGGAANGDAFGRRVRSAGDVNADGIPDFIVGAHLGNLGAGAGAGYIRVFNGATGAQIHQVAGVLPGDNLGSAVAGVGDANRDGFDDFLLGAQGRDAGGNNNSGVCFLMSGLTNTPLEVFPGTNIGDQLGFEVAGLGDVDGDSYADFALAKPFSASGGAGAGEVDLYRADRQGVPGLYTTYGAGCPTSDSTLPRIGGSDFPVLDETFDVTLSSALGPATNVFLLYASPPPISFDLTLSGFPGCTLLVFPIAAIPDVTDALGRASQTVVVPNLPGLVGQSVYLQWAIDDPAANPGALTFSDGLGARIGLEDADV